MGIVPVASFAASARCRAVGDEDIDLARNEVSGKLPQPGLLPLRKLAFHGDDAAFDVAKPLQSLQEGIDQVEAGIGRLGAARRQDAYCRHLR